MLLRFWKQSRTALNHTASPDIPCYVKPLVSPTWNSLDTFAGLCDNGMISTAQPCPVIATENLADW